MQHKAVAEIRGFFGWDDLAQRVFHLDRVLDIFDKAQPVGQPDAVGIGDDGGLPIDVAQDQVGGLAADAGQFQKICHIVRHFAAEVGQQHLGAGFEVTRFGAEQAAGLDAFLNRLERGFGKAFERWKIYK